MPDRRYFYASEYRDARKPHVCSGGCGEPILPGHTYLNYVHGLHARVAVCLACSVVKANGFWNWPCSAVRDRIRELGAAAGHQVQRALAL